MGSALFGPASDRLIVGISSAHASPSPSAIEPPVDSATAARVVAQQTVKRLVTVSSPRRCGFMIIGVPFSVQDPRLDIPSQSHRRVYTAVSMNRFLIISLGLFVLLGPSPYTPAEA